MKKLRSVCVYCGSSPGVDPTHVRAAHMLGQEIGRARLGLVYGGGTNGLMGAVSRGVMETGGTVTGIIPRFLMQKEATEEALKGLDELIVTEDMHERKHAMFERADAFVTMPGGIGTLEELVEILTWAQLGRHTKPVLLVNTGRFWEPLLALIDHMRQQGFIHSGHLVQPLVVQNAEAVIPALLEAANGAQGDAAIIERL